MYNLKINELLEKYPFVEGYFESNKLNIKGHENKTFKEFLDSFTEMEIEDFAIDKEALLENLADYIEQMKSFLGVQEETGIQSLTILPGYDKSRKPEGFDELTIHKSEIISIVGPTGSGKSRLLADIEWTAQNDTPTGRTILIDGEKSPIVLIDEIENAGIDRRKALNLLIGENKIVLIATHDPTLALIADKRIVINNGGIYKVINTSKEEKEILEKLERIDHYVQGMRENLRYGKELSDNKKEE